MVKHSISSKSLQWLCIAEVFLISITNNKPFGAIWGSALAAERIDNKGKRTKAYAAAMGLTIMKEYADAAISGTTSARPQYKLMLSEIEKIKPAALILWKTDRLGRDKCELVWAKKTIRDAGCSIHLVAEPTPDDSPESVLMESFLEGMTEYYSRNLSGNIRRGMEYNAEHGLLNEHRIFGYKVDENKKYIIDDTQAPFVRRMFIKYIS